MPEALDVDWQALRLSAEQGVPLPRLAAKFGIAHAALKQRCWREKWQIPSRIKAKAQELGLLPSVTTTSETADLATKTAAESLLEFGDRGTMTAAKLLSGLLDRAGRRPGKLSPLRDVGDVVTALKGVRIAAGLDRDAGVQVNVALFGAGSSDSAGFEV